LIDFAISKESFVCREYEFYYAFMACSIDLRAVLNLYKVVA